MKASIINALVFVAVVSASLLVMAQGTAPPAYNPDKIQTPNTKPGSRTEDGLMGLTGTTGMQGATGTKGSTGPTGHKGGTMQKK